MRPLVGTVLRTGALTVLLALGLSACAAGSPSGTDLDFGRNDRATSAAEATVGADPNLGGMDYQARQLADSLPQFDILTQRPVGGTAVSSTPPTPTSTPTPTAAASASAGLPLDACSIVTASLLDRDLGIDVTASPVPGSSALGDPNARDCYYGDANGIVVAEATTRADSDLAESRLADPTGQPGETEAIPGVDRGYAYVPDPTATSGAAALVVVVHGRGLRVALTAAQPISIDQVVRLGTDLAAALR